MPCPYWLFLEPAPLPLSSVTAQNTLSAFEAPRSNFFILFQRRFYTCPVGEQPHL
jgi:hypothetical protein